MLIVVAALSGCAAPPEQQPADTAPQLAKCVAVTGSNVCRKDGSGQIANVTSVPGKVLTSRPGGITEPAPTKTGD